MIARHTRAAALRRSAYTLLEMSLALAISLIILGAVYEFLNRQTMLAEMGRDLVDETKLAHYILNAMADDIASSLGGVDPKQLPVPATVDGVDPTLLATDAYTPLFNNGIEGSESLLILSVSRVPGELLWSDKRQLDSSTLPRVCDLRRISYWFAQDGVSPGLVRQVLTDVASGEFDVKPPDVGAAGKVLVSDKVTSLQFEYFDGAAWQPEWNSNTYAVDGATPKGPPAAVRITMWIQMSKDQQPKQYRRTVALPAGNNFSWQIQGN